MPEPLIALPWTCLVIGVLACAIGCAQESEPPKPVEPPRTCGTDFQLTSEGIGEFRIGRTVEEIRAKCKVIRDTTLPFASEGQPERRLKVAIASDSVEATISENTVWRIEVTSSRFRTADSVGVGTTVRELRKQPIKFYGYGEIGPFVGLPRHCGLSLKIDDEDRRPRSVALLRPDAKVELVLILGCTR